MPMTMVEKILAAHSKYGQVKPGDIVDILIDARIARDFGGANVVKNILSVIARYIQLKVRLYMRMKRLFL